MHPVDEQLRLGQGIHAVDHTTRYGQVARARSVVSLNPTVRRAFASTGKRPLQKDAVAFTAWGEFNVTSEPLRLSYDLICDPCADRSPLHVQVVPDKIVDQYDPHTIESPYIGDVTGLLERVPRSWIVGLCFAPLGAVGNLRRFAFSRLAFPTNPTLLFLQLERDESKFLFGGFLLIFHVHFAGASWVGVVLVPQILARSRTEGRGLQTRSVSLPRPKAALVEGAAALSFLLPSQSDESSYGESFRSIRDREQA